MTAIGVTPSALQRIPYPIGLAGLVTLVAALAILVRALDPSIVPNIATHAKITASSQQPPHDQVQHLVDGDAWQIGFHTLTEPDPWILFELGETESISRIVIYNRVDCCQAAAVPLTIELGSNGQTFRTVARKGDSFEKWIVEIPPQSARFLRVQLHRTGALHLNEIEVR